MSKPEIISEWDWPDTEWVPDGYDMKEVPKLSEKNFIYLIGLHNELVEYVSKHIDGGE